MYKDATDNLCRIEMRSPETEMKWKPIAYFHSKVFMLKVGEYIDNISDPDCIRRAVDASGVVIKEWK